MIIALIILSVLFSASAGLSKAFADLSDEGNLKGDPHIRHKDYSWQNKWENGDKSQGEKFFGSSRWFILFTDTWHRADLSRNFLLPLSGCCIGVLAILVSPYYMFGLLVNHIIFATTFHIFHTTKVLRK